jgi:hypothetical protein
MPTTSVRRRISRFKRSWLGRPGRGVALATDPVSNKLVIQGSCFGRPAVRGVLVVAFAVDRRPGLGPVLRPPETARACPAANHLAACRPAHPELADLRPIYPAANKSSRHSYSAFGAHAPLSPPGGYSPSVSSSWGHQGRKVQLDPRGCAQSRGWRPRPRIHHCMHAAAQTGPIPSRGKLIWSTGTYPVCGRCSYGDQGPSPNVAARQGEGRRLRRGRPSPLPNRIKSPRRQTGKERQTPRSEGLCGSPLAGSNRLPSPYHLSTGSRCSQLG